VKRNVGSDSPPVTTSKKLSRDGEGRTGFGRGLQIAQVRATKKMIQVRKTYRIDWRRFRFLLRLFALEW